jgi:ATP-binding cassette subfamily F protein uup
LDEPTNDLDAETLDLLEDLLVEFQGTLLLVSHDREFLDEVVTSTLVYEGDGQWGDYVGGYTDWLNEKRKLAALPGGVTRSAGEPAKSVAVAPVAAETKSSGRDPVPASSRRKLSNKEQKELEVLPAKIETLEKEQTELTAKLADPAFYKNEAVKFSQVKARLESLEREHATAFARWEELEGRTSATSAG